MIYQTEQCCNFCTVTAMRTSILKYVSDTYHFKGFFHSESTVMM